MTLCVQQQASVAILEPDADDPGNIDMIIKKAKKRAPLSFTRLYEAIPRDAADSFISKLEVNLRKITTMSLQRKEGFPVEVVLHVLSLYRQLITVYLDTEALLQEELSIPYSNMVESRDRHSPHERFKSFFTTFSTPVPTGFQEVFGENVQLAIDCWAALTWQERQKLRSGFLVRDIFESLDTIKVSGCVFDWMPAPDYCPCVIADGRFKTDVQKFLGAITRSCSSLVGYNKDSWADLAQNVQDRCWQEWERRTFSDKELPKLPYRVKDDQSLLQGMELDEYRAYTKKHYIDRQEPASLMGGKEMLLLVLQEDSYLNSLVTASDLIKKLEAYICRYGTRVNATVVPETLMTSNVYFNSLQTLKDGGWVSTQVVDFILMHYALCTGGCCDKFPLPLVGSDGRRVFYCDTTVWLNIIPNQKKWRFDFRNYDFIYMPAHVDGNHYIGFSIAMTSNGKCGSLQSFDSMGSARRSERGMVLEWLKFVAPDIEWSHCKGTCPSQGNGYDCAIFTILCGTYFDKVPLTRTLAKVPLTRTLAECYSSVDIPAVRKMMVLLSIKVGNDMRSDAPWCPFSDAGSPATTGWEARPRGGDDDTLSGGGDNDPTGRGGNRHAGRRHAQVRRPTIPPRYRSSSFDTPPPSPSPSPSPSLPLPLPLSLSLSLSLSCARALSLFLSLSLTTSYPAPLLPVPSLRCWRIPRDPGPASTRAGPPPHYTSMLSFSLPTPSPSPPPHPHPPQPSLSLSLSHSLFTKTGQGGWAGEPDEDGPGGRAGDPDDRGARRQRAGGGRQGSPTTTGRGGRAGELSDDGEPDDDWPGRPTGGGQRRWR